MAIGTPEKEARPLWMEVKKNKNKTLIFGCLACWSVCVATYAYQYLGGFVHWPYWCLIHLVGLSGSITSMIVGSTPLDSPPSLSMKLVLFLVSLYMPLFAITDTIKAEYRALDFIYVFMAFFAVDMYGCVYVASLTRLKHTFYWPFLCHVFGLALSSAYGLPAAPSNPLWCKIVVGCSALAVAATSTIYLYVRRRRLVSNETPRVAFARCFV